MSEMHNHHGFTRPPPDPSINLLVDLLAGFLTKCYQVLESCWDHRGCWEHAWIQQNSISFHVRMHSKSLLTPSLYTGACSVGNEQLTSRKSWNNDSPYQGYPGSKFIHVIIKQLKVEHVTTGWKGQRSVFGLQAWSSNMRHIVIKLQIVLLFYSATYPIFIVLRALIFFRSNAVVQA